MHTLEQIERELLEARKREEKRRLALEALGWGLMLGRWVAHGKKR